MCRRARRTLAEWVLHLDRRGDRVAARRLQRPLPFDLDHADAAHAGQAQVLVVAERGDADAQLLGGLEDRRAQRHRDRVAVDRSTSICLPIALACCDAPRRCGASGSSGPASAAGSGLQVVGHVGLLVRMRRRHATRSRPRISSWKCSTIESKALGADWPRPHFDGQLHASRPASRARWR